MASDEKLYTSHQAAELLQMDPSSVVKWVNDGKLPAYRTPGGHRRIKASDLVSFLRKHGMYVPPELGAAKRKVLLVDDDKTWLASIKRAFKAQPELELQATDSPIDALIQVGSYRPDVLVLDVAMPEMDGLEVLRRLRESPETRGLEVVVLTGQASPELERKVKALGARACLAKPVSPAELLAQLGAGR